jgi:hypothetical protein
MLPVVPLTYIAFLRAVNVGRRKVPMAQVRSCLSAGGLKRVRTYLASGNAFFDSDEPPRVAEIEAWLRAEFQFEIPIVLRSVSEVEALLSANPFGGHERREDNRFLITMAQEPITDSDLQVVDGSLLVWRRERDVASIITLREGKWPTKGVVRDNAGCPVATSRFHHTLFKIVDAARS